MHQQDQQPAGKMNSLFKVYGRFCRAEAHLDMQFVLAVVKMRTE